MTIREDANIIIKAAIRAALPDTAVHKALQNLPSCQGRLLLVAVGKAAYQMACAACNALGEQIDTGIVITKYHHAKDDLKRIRVFEAGHPVPDDHTYRATQAVMDVVADLSSDDLVLFLLSGGGSALFEKPLIAPEELQHITDQLLASGANIVEMNTIRKRLSAVKGGRFAKLCEPAKIFSVVLSDIVGDPLDMIASGPACLDVSTCEEALEIARRYHLQLSPAAERLLHQETPKAIYNVETHITGSVRQLCTAAETECRRLGYNPLVLTSELTGEAKMAGKKLAELAQKHQNTTRSLAFIMGGETVVHVTGNGLGGRNQELALSAAEGISGLSGTAIFSVGSDGTDGPTDAAGGFVNGDTFSALLEKGICVADVLAQNDAYHALKAADGLIITGPTGTNVNDLSVLLIKR